MTSDFAVASQQHLLLACFPKSGSSLLAFILAGLPGFQRVSLIPDYGRREAELSLHHLVEADRLFPRFIAKHHLRFSQETGRLIESFSLQPIVLVRNIFDVVASIRDQIRREPVVMAQAYVPPDASQWEKRHIEEFVADMIIPWYFNFFASWGECSDRMEVTFEELVADPFSTVRRIRDMLHIEATDAQVGTAVEMARSMPIFTRFNVGLCGRGRELTASATAKVSRLAKHYSFLDLSSIGLPEGGRMADNGSEHL